MIARTICLVFAGWVALGARGAEMGFEIAENVPEALPRIAQVRQITQSPKHHFFGYYAICPWDATGRYLVCMESDFGDRAVQEEDVAGICLIDTKSGELRRIAETSAWNFQQGALVHWLGERPEIVYNDLVEGRLKAMVLNIETGERRVLPRPITSVARDGTWAACISFGRLNTTRPGYGYPGVDDPFADEPHPKGDGLWRMDMATGECILIASLDAVYRASPLPEEYAGKAMWMNLVIVSRDGGHVAFLSRYYGEHGWFTGLFTVGADGSELRCVIPYAWGGSHFDWADGERIIITTRLHGKHGGHVIFTNGEDDHRLLAPDVITRDGHCHVSWDGRWMVTDSYPVGTARMQHFYMLDMKTEEVALLGRFHEPEAYAGDWRCDLHPRWSRDSKKVCIDSTHDGTRQVYVLDLELPEEREAADMRWVEAARNGETANEVFSRCKRMVQAWYRHRGHGNWLIPDNLQTRIWRPENAAADNWSFWVIATYLTDRETFEGPIRKTLEDEIRLTTRLGWLPDAFVIDTGEFERPKQDLDRLLFGASEYVKDGLLPIAELLGRTVWFERARGILDDIFRYATPRGTPRALPTPHGMLPSTRAEVNGEMLQSLCRFYFATGDKRYKTWAECIGDAYFLDMLPKSNGLPCHDWDFEAGTPRRDVLSLSDHGNEIIFGLSELMALEHACDAAKAAQYLPAMRRMIDTLLDIAVNEHGLWVHSIEPSTGKVLNAGTPDTWGYALDAVYTFYMITGESKYREAVHRALRGINADPKYREWGGADAFADSIESGIVLLNRIPEPEALEWLEATVPTFLAKQREDGIIEGWHGDGNYARTALMYALMKTAGTRVSNWREDLRFGAVVRSGALYVALQATEPWEGLLHFDAPRHRVHLGLPMNYPRLNEFPEWYPVEPARLYKVIVEDKESTVSVMLGDDLIRGLPVRCGTEPVHVTVRPVPGPAYGARRLRLEAPAAHAGEGPFRLPVTVHNGTGAVQQVQLTTTFGTLEPTQGHIPVDAVLKAWLSGDLTTSGEAVVEAVSGQGAHLSRTIRLVHDKNLVGYIAFDHETYKGTPYQWCGHRPIEFTLPARKGNTHTLHLRWGSKNDERVGIVSINGRTQEVKKGGYDGFEWIELAIPADLAASDAVQVTITGKAGTAHAAFIAEAKLTCP